ncbi:MAG: ATP phosphoribosyltransferase regulatory subunit [Clostridia bacterium]|nr:ATP phosphoribosyltransferase regulatory subunit [Clostridia bacterium]
MEISNLSLGFDERLIFSLRALYEQNGYSHYRMSKFEEYDLYARNKDFLISDSVITFTDMDGRLLALKPDVTLSIIKNLSDSDNYCAKLYYNENVYRVAGGNRSFKEIMQTGLECFGNIDSYSLCEVVTLAAESLRLVSSDSVLDLSNLDLISEILDSLALGEQERKEFLRLTGEKNTHELRALLSGAGVAEDKANRIIEAVSTYGSADTVIPKIRELLYGIADLKPLELLCEIIDGLNENIRKMVNIDFSVVDNMKYYNGIVFKGFVNGVPTAVLSGGQYNRLMKRLGRNFDAVGFAVYHDTLDRLYDEQSEFDADALLLYKDCSLSAIREAVNDLKAKYESVRVQNSMPENAKFRRVFLLEENILKELN